jgi:hypothetical protein
MFTATATRIQNLCPYHKKVKVIYSGRGQKDRARARARARARHCVTGAVSTHDVMYTGFYF